MTGIMKKIANMFTSKQKKAVYYWAGQGENPLKHLGIEDMKK